MGYNISQTQMFNFTSQYSPKTTYFENVRHILLQLFMYAHVRFAKKELEKTCNLVSEVSATEIIINVVTLLNETIPILELKHACANLLWKINKIIKL